MSAIQTLDNKVSEILTNLPRCCWGLTVSAKFGNLLEIQILRPQPRLPGIRSSGDGASHSCSEEPPRWFQWVHWSLVCVGKGFIGDHILQAPGFGSQALGIDSNFNFPFLFSAKVICIEVWISGHKLWLILFSLTLIQTLCPGVEGDAILVVSGPCPLPEPSGCREASMDLGIWVSLPVHHNRTDSRDPARSGSVGALSLHSSQAAGNLLRRVPSNTHLSHFQPHGTHCALHSPTLHDPRLYCFSGLLWKARRTLDFWLLLHLILQESLKPQSPKALRKQTQLKISASYLVIVISHYYLNKLICIIS